MSLMPVVPTFPCALLVLGFAAQGAAGPACSSKKHIIPKIVHRGDFCALSSHAPKVALLFLARGPVPYEPMWRRWFHEISHLAYSGCIDGGGDHFADCKHERAATPIAQQHLYTVLYPLQGLLTGQLCAPCLVESAGGPRGQLCK